MSSADADWVPAGMRERLVAPVLRAAAQLALRPMLSPRVPLAWQRWWLRQLARTTWAGRDVAIEQGRVGGIAGEWLRPTRAPAATMAVLYLHGGGYCAGSPVTHRALTSRLASAARLPVFAAAYRLAPEHRFPAALEDATAAYRALLAAGPVIIAGDSAGAGVAVATALKARENGISAPKALVLFSPWIDLSLSNLPDEPPVNDALLTAPWLAACARLYAGEDLTASLASPIGADLRGLPPTLIQAGGDELLLRDATRLRDALADAGVSVRCDIAPGRWHAFQLHAGWLPSADAAIARAGQFITSIGTAAC